MKPKQLYNFLTLFQLASIITMIFVSVIVLTPWAFAVNATAINEIQNDLSPELVFDNSFSVFWIIFLLIILAVFMFTMIVKREWREMVFFAIGALIVSILITLLFISPVSFDYTVNQNKVTVEEISWLDGSITYNSGVTDTVDQIPIIPNDTSFRFAMQALFTGISLFNGLYAIFILTNYDTRKN